MAEEKPTKGRAGVLLTVNIFVPVPPRDQRKAMDAGRVIERIKLLKMQDGDDKLFEVTGFEELAVDDFVNTEPL